MNKELKSKDKSLFWITVIFTFSAIFGGFFGGLLVVSELFFNGGLVDRFILENSLTLVYIIIPIIFSLWAINPEYFEAVIYGVIFGFLGILGIGGSIIVCMIFYVIITNATQNLVCATVTAMLIGAILFGTIKHVRNKE